MKGWLEALVVILLYTVQYKHCSITFTCLTNPSLSWLTLATSPMQAGDNTHFQVWVWGTGPCLALGAPEATMLRPRPVDELAALRIVDISAGDSHVLALTHDSEVSAMVCVCVYYVKCSLLSQNVQRWLYTRCNLLWQHNFHCVHSIELLFHFFFIRYFIVLLLIGTQSLLNPQTKVPCICVPKLSIYTVYRCMHGAPTQWVNVVRDILCHPSWGRSVLQGWMCQSTKSVLALLTLWPGLPFPLTGLILHCLLSS